MADVSVSDSLAAMAGTVSRRPTMSESRKTVLLKHASGRDDHIPRIGTG